ncbi:MAG: MarR family transcriptional regulator [Parvularcula sp.]|nr:MarR family transcriptional regulator [Parvularcula sp.]
MFSSSSHLLERLARLVHNDAHTGGLKPTQWEALRYLARANRFSRSPGALTSYLGMTKGTVSQTLQALERKGLIEKQAASGDRRGVKLDLTSAGDRLLTHDPLGDLDASINALPKEDQKRFGAMLEGLMKNMLHRRSGKAFGACKTCRHFRHRHDRGAPHFCSLLSEPLSRNDSDQICAEQEAAA